MPKQMRMVTVTALALVAVVAWLALLAFSTPTEASESQPVLALGLVASGTVLALSAATWWRAEGFSAEVRVLSIVVPCAALIGLSLAGALPFDPSTGGLPSGLVALLSVALVVASVRSARPTSRPAGA